MSSFKFDPSQPGLRKILKEWEELALRYVWSVGEEARAGEIQEFTKKKKEIEHWLRL